MVTRNSFIEVRRDGRVIDESMTTDRMLEEGWLPDKVIALRWDWSGTMIELRTAFGFLAQIVPDREYVAVLEEIDGTGDHAVLSVYNANGALHRSFRNLVEVAGTLEVGEFSWFEEPVSPLPTAFSPVFTVARTGGTFQVDIDAASGAVLGVNEVR